MIASNSLSPALPCAAVMPSSAICARKALITWVRFRIKRSRVRCSINWLCCSADLACTKRMVGRRTASQIASASASIVLVALDVGLHIPRRHQTNLVTKLREFTRPIMGGGARLHADKARRQRLEELQHLAAPKLLPNNDLLGRVDPVNLKHVLGDIQTDRGDLHVDGSLM